MRKRFERQIIKICYKMENSRLLSIIRRGLAMMIPPIVLGAVALAVLNFPGEAFHHLITEQYAGICAFLNLLYQATFGMFSMLLVIALSISYALEQKETIDQIPFYLITAAASFGSQVILAEGDMKYELIGSRGCFIAMVVGLLSCFLFSKLKKIECISLKQHTSGMEIIPATAVHCMIPAALTIGCFALVQYSFLTITDGKSMYVLWSECSCQVFGKLGNGFLPALLYTILVHVLWVFGIHGSNMMEPVAQDYFGMVGAGSVFSKSFFDTFIVMGGCGTTICAIIAIFLFAGKKRTRNIGKFAFPMVIFNTNDILSFGMPIILNPVLAVPFICVPVLALCVSYGAVSAGLVPYVTNEITWTMPVLFSGYAATGSGAGCVLQLVIIVLGVAVYTPFLRLYEKIYEQRMKEKIEKLIHELQMYEEKGEDPHFLERLDDFGMVARMMVQDLEQAIRQRKLYLLYQPQVDRKGMVMGAEALLRWEHSEYGFMYPPLIIQLAKEGGLQSELEQMLFELAIGAVKEISAVCDKPFKISVNITAHSLEWDMEKYLEEKLEEYQVPAEKLWLEITEQDVLINSRAEEKKMQQLRDAGHKLLIDDFGMGHTSLNYLQSGYFDVVKLDGSLVRHITERETDQKLVSSIIEMGQKLNIKVTAEYVETEEQYLLLKKLGCDWYQGYFFSKPVPLEQFIRRIQENE